MNEVTKKEDGSIQIKLVIPWPDIQSAYEKEVDETIANTEIQGFRKGKAPRDLVEPKLDKSQLYSHAVQHLLPKIYSTAVKEHNLKPILYPQISIQKNDFGQDWQFTATTCEAPEVILPEKLAKLDELRKIVAVKVPDLLVVEEVNHRLAALVENITQLGLTTESYLQSKKLTPETLKTQLSGQARSDLETEFILLAVQQGQKLADRKATLDFLQTLV